MRVKRVNAGIRAISEIYSFMVNDRLEIGGGDGCGQKNFSFYSKNALFEKMRKFEFREWNLFFRLKII